MSKTSYLLLVIFTTIIVCFFAASFLFPATTKFNTLSKKPIPTPSITQTTIALAPAVQTLSAGQTSFVDITIANEGASSPDTIQLEIGYDPSMLTPMVITPGKYFNEQTLLLNDINPRNARITFAVTCTNKPSPCGSDPSQKIARISFMINPLGVKKETALTILPKSIVDNSNAEIILKTINTKIYVQRNTAPVASPSAALVQ